MFLDSILRTLKAKIEGAHTTTAPVVEVGFADVSANATVFAPGEELNTFNGATEITILSAPANNVQRQVKSINVCNLDTVTHSFTFTYYNDTTPYRVIKINVPADTTVLWTYENGWVIQGVGGAVTSINAVGGAVTFADTAEIDFSTDTSTAIITADLKNNSVVVGRLHATATARLFGRSTAGAGAGEELTVGTGLSLSAGSLTCTITQYTDEMAQDAVGAMVDSSLVYVDATPLLTRAALTGDVTASQGSNVTTVANDAVTYAKMQNVSAASKLLGRGDSGSGDPQEITLGAGLSMSGTTLNASGNGQASNSIQDFRLTFESGVPISTTDQTAKTTLYCTPYTGNSIALYDGVGTWNTRTSAEFSISLAGLTANTNYDVFCYDNSGTPTLELLAWTNDTTRATALVRQNGVLVKSGATTRRHMGILRITGTTGQSEYSATKRFLRNRYNRVTVQGANAFTAIRTTTSTSWAELNSEIRIGFLVFDGEIVESSINGVCWYNSATFAYVDTAVGFDGTTPEQKSYCWCNNAATLPALSNNNRKLALAEGYHYITALGQVSSGAAAGEWGDTNRFNSINIAIAA